MSNKQITYIPNAYRARTIFESEDTNDESKKQIIAGI
jgi:hypothetical protein